MTIFFRSSYHASILEIIFFEYWNILLKYLSSLAKGFLSYKGLVIFTGYPLGAFFWRMIWFAPIIILDKYFGPLNFCWKELVYNWKRMVEKTDFSSMILSIFNVYKMFLQKLSLFFVYNSHPYFNQIWNFSDILEKMWNFPKLRGVKFSRKNILAPPRYTFISEWRKIWLYWITFV